MIPKPMLPSFAVLMMIASVGIARAFSSVAPGVPAGIPVEAQSALAQAQKWHPDARLIKVIVVSNEPKPFSATFYFRSASSGEACKIESSGSANGFTLSSGQNVPATEAGTGLPFDPPFKDYDDVLGTAQKAGLKDDPGGQLLDEDGNGSTQLIWTIGNYRIDAVTGRLLSRQFNQVAAPDVRSANH
jgi:hypothetical protein